MSYIILFLLYFALILFFRVFNIFCTYLHLYLISQGLIRKFLVNFYLYLLELQFLLIFFVFFWEYLIDSLLCNLLTCYVLLAILLFIWLNTYLDFILIFILLLPTCVFLILIWDFLIFVGIFAVNIEIITARIYLAGSVNGLICIVIDNL